MTSLVDGGQGTRIVPIPAPRFGPTVCRICRGPVHGGSVQCWCCRKICQGLRTDPASVPPVVPMGLYRPGDPWNVVLRRYKDAPVGAARRHYANLLRVRTAQYLSLHGSCLVRETSGFQAYCVVPSSQVRRIGTAPHPLEAVLGDLTAMRSLGVVRLSAGAEPASHLRPRVTAFVPQESGDIAASRVLVVDDSWITGSRALSAVATLGAAGVSVAGVFILGRSVDPSASALSRAWWGEHASQAPRSARFRERCCMRECLAPPTRP